MDIAALSPGDMLGPSVVSACRTCCLSPALMTHLCGFSQSYWTACALIFCYNIAAQWRLAKNEVIGNEAGIELQGVAEPVIWKVKCPAEADARVCPLVNTSHLLHHGGDPVTTVWSSGKKCRNPQKCISRNGAVTPRNIPIKTSKFK